MPEGALSQGVALLPKSPLARECNLTCNNVPYPFGARGSSLPGLPDFEVTCGQNNEAMLQISGNSYKMEDVSVDRGFVVILAGPIRQVCYDRNGKPTQGTGTGDMSLEGTPFSFSKRNRLVVTGCNYRLLAKFGNSLNSDNIAWLPAACSSWCNGSTNVVDENSCLEQTACCEALMPMDGALEFTLTFNNISEHITSNQVSTCNTAFFLDRDDQVFMGGKDGKQRALKDVLSPAGNRSMVLDWAVGRGTCDQASNYNLSPMYCNSMSRCIDAPRGAGYICKCNAGYDGNPYASGGCVGNYFFTRQIDIH